MLRVLVQPLPFKCEPGRPVDRDASALNNPRFGQRSSSGGIKQKLVHPGRFSVGWETRGGGEAPR